MWSLIIFLFLLILSVWAGVTLISHPGYLLLVYQPWMIQMPVWFAALALFLAFLLFYILIDSFDRIQFLWFRLKNWLRFRSEHKSYNKTQHGLSSLIEGRWKKSERLLLAGINQTVTPLINYLAAARAAHEQQAFDRRDSYIQKAYKVAPHEELAIGLIQAKLELKQDQLEHAAATLNHLRQTSPRHPRVLELLEKVYVRLGDWQALEAILPSMYKAKLLTNENLHLFEKNLYSEMLRSATNKNLDDIRKMWQDMPRSARKNPDVVYEYVKQLRCFDIVNNSVNNEIEDLIAKTLNQHWQPKLVEIYGNLPFNNLNKQLVIVGNWLKTYGPHPELLLTLGKLCVRVQLWGKAKDYFEKCLALGPNSEASLEYGRLLEYLGEPEEAMQKYKEGLQHNGHYDPVLLRE